MFTGLIEDIGIISSIVPAGRGLKISVKSSKLTSDMAIGDSIAISGVCQTVIEITGDSFTVDTVEETLKKTTLMHLRAGEKVNLERALLPTSRMGGHFVLGHVDTTGTIKEIARLSNSTLITIGYDSNFSKYIIPVGSIAVDGISLTVAELTDTFFSVAIIPHTFSVTVLNKKSTGEKVNLEFDVLGKYVLRNFEAKKESKITESWLREQGFG